MTNYSVAKYFADFLGNERIEEKRSEVFSSLLNPLLKKYRIRNQFGRPYRFDEPFLSRLLEGKINLPRKIILAARRSLLAFQKGRNAYLLLCKLRPFVEPKEVAQRIFSSIERDALVSVNEKERMKELFLRDLPSFFERAFLLSLSFDNKGPAYMPGRPRGRPPFVEKHPDYASLSPEEQKGRAALYLPRLARKGERSDEGDYREFLSILSYGAYPFSPKSRARTLKAILSGLPRKTAIEPALAFKLRFEKDTASWTGAAREEASVFLSLVEPLAAELKVSELKSLEREAVEKGKAETFLEAARKTASAFYWRKSSPTFPRLLKAASWLDDERLDVSTRKALKEAFSSLEGSS